jgi:hypothetical protein
MHFSCDLPEDVRPEQGKTFIKLFGGDGSEVGHDLAAMPDGGFVMTGINDLRVSSRQRSFCGAD